MPVQINELIIRANITEEAGKKNSNTPQHGAGSNIEKSDVVKECVAIVMEILSNKQTR